MRTLRMSAAPVVSAPHINGNSNREVGDAGRMRILGSAIEPGGMLNPASFKLIALPFSNGMWYDTRGGVGGSTLLGHCCGKLTRDHGGGGSGGGRIRVPSIASPCPTGRGVDCG